MEILESQLKSISSIVAQRTVFTKKDLDRRYGFGQQALKRLIDASQLITFFHRILDVEQQMNISTTIWSDETLRNGYDQLRDYGTPASLVGASAGALMLASSDQGVREAGAYVLASGAVAAALFQAIGSVLGEDSAENVTALAHRIELSRRAYDDVRERNNLLRTYVKDNKAFIGRLTEFRDRYDQAIYGPTEAAIRRAKEEYLGELQGYITDFEQVLGQVPSLLNQYKVVGEKYQKYEIKEVEENMEFLAKKVDSIRSDYELLIRPILSIAPELRRELTPQTLSR